jgi:hypothetical protein
LTKELNEDAANPIITPELNVIPRINYGYLKYLFIKGYIKTIGVTAIPSFTHSIGKLNKTPKFTAINPDKKIAPYLFEISPVVKGLALVLSTCLSISLSAKSFIIQPADLHPRAPI